MNELLTKTFYQTFQQSKSAFALTHKRTASQLRRLISPPRPEPESKPMPPETIDRFKQRYEQLLETDWQDAQRDIYPVELLFDNPWEDFFLYYPVIWLERPKIWQRIEQKKYQEFSPEIDTAGYPQYYLQNFHYQTDGYLSDLSASLYDLQVELVFNGVADAMRRRVLAPLQVGLLDMGLESAAAPKSTTPKSTTPKSTIPERARILDVACGTGRTLKFIRATLPKASLFGIDLSPPYLRKAARLLSDDTGDLPQLVQANAEEMPYRDSYFHAITCVFLFHELPGTARQNIIDECFRVLQPGGTFIICDSIQIFDSPELEPMMEGFARVFHEPYYNDYIRDNLLERLEQAGFEKIDEQIHFSSKYLVASKPKARV